MWFMQDEVLQHFSLGLATQKSRHQSSGFFNLASTKRQVGLSTKRQVNVGHLKQLRVINPIFRCFSISNT